MEVHINDVSTDSVLSDNLMSATGSMVLSRGTKLTKAILNRLRKMGIMTLTVDTSDAGQLIAEREELMAALEYRFAGTEDNIYLQELKRVAIAHLRF